MGVTLISPVRTKPEPPSIHVIGAGWGKVPTSMYGLYVDIKLILRNLICGVVLSGTYIPARTEVHMAR